MEFIDAIRETEVTPGAIDMVTRSLANGRIFDLTENLQNVLIEILKLRCIKRNIKTMLVRLAS